MANLIKIKKRVMIASGAIILTLLSLERQFDENFVIKKWDKDSILTWDDFQGPIPTFTSYGAVISSELYVEFDSIDNKYYAYAGQHNKDSWTKEEMNDSEDGLRHEQYHFNITEIHSRMLNFFIDSFPDAGLDEINRRKAEINSELSYMQTDYDDETDHSLIEDQQQYWEYKIDSEMLELEGKTGMSIDYFSGIAAFFPSAPDTLVFVDTQWVEKGVYLWRYGMEFRYLVSYDYNIDTAAWKEHHDEGLVEDGFTQIETTDSYWDNFYILETECVDTSNYMNYYVRQLYKFPYKYHIMVSMPSSPEDPTNYLSMQFKFLNSIEIEPRIDHWIEVYNSDQFETNESTLTEEEKKKADDPNSDYYRFRYPGQSEFAVEYHLPFKFEDKVLLPFKILRHNTEEIKEVIVVVNDRVYDQEADSLHQLIALDQNAFNPGENWIHFGYVLKEDSLSEVYYLYGSVVEYWHTD